jgi:hypothetical protein
MYILETIQIKRDFASISTTNKYQYSAHTNATVIIGVRNGGLAPE